MKPCRECSNPISPRAQACPRCGAPFPAREKWDGYGYEFKSQTTFWGVPLLHISFKYSPNRVPVVARGILAIGQFAVGVITISQFGLGIFSVSQFTVAVYALAQMAIAYICVAQFGLYIHGGMGQAVGNLSQVLGWFF